MVVNPFSDNTRPNVCAINTKIHPAPLKLSHSCFEKLFCGSGFVLTPHKTKIKIKAMIRIIKIIYFLFLQFYQFSFLIQKVRYLIFDCCNLQPLIHQFRFANVQ